MDLPMNGVDNFDGEIVIVGDGWNSFRWYFCWGDSSFVGGQFFCYSFIGELKWNFGRRSFSILCLGVLGLDG